MIGHFTRAKRLEPAIIFNNARESLLIDAQIPFRLAPCSKIIGIDIDAPADAGTAGYLLDFRHGLGQHRAQ